MKTIFNKYFTILLIVGSFLVIKTSCSTEKNTWINRTFHSTHAKYNGFFNANEIIATTVKDYETNFTENYDVIIPVFIYPNETDSKAFYPPMDTASAKCERVIVKHSMPGKKTGQNKRVEWAKWIDENWMTRGKANFYKRDYKKADEIFNYVEKTYPSNSSSIMAKVWKAKVLIELGQYTDAKKILDQLLEIQTEKEEAEQKEKDAKKKKETTTKKPAKSKVKGKKPTAKKEDTEAKKAELPEDFDETIWPIYADLYLRTKDYEKAIEALEKSIETVENRTFKTRLIFILAQLKHQQGNQEASDLYGEVVKRNPKYDMAFNAKINKALAFSGGDVKGIKAELLKMLKDAKNLSFQDQIYYALGELELRDNEIPMALEYYEKSVASNTSNANQKTKSFLKLGDLHYQQKNYVKAQQYYDSTMTVLEKTHPKYDEISFRNESLTELVKHLNAAQGQDSLLRLCELSPNDLEKKISALIEAEEQRIKEEEEKKKNEMASIPAPTNTGGGARFWAYDPNLRALGQADFKKVWGDRKNEDDWRRSDKTASFDGESGGKSEMKNPKLTPEYYLKNLPCNDLDAKAKANESIIQGWYGAAQVYKNKLNDEPEAIAAFKKLERFLPHEKSIASLYQLYLLYQSKGNTTEASKYKEKILSNYGETEYAKMIKDPNYFQNTLIGNQKEEKDYEQIYASFKTGNYSQTVEQCNEKIKDKNNPYLCKYLYLKTFATAYGNSNPSDLAPVETALEELIQLCSDEEIKTNAKLLLDRLRNQQSVIDTKSGASKYIYASDSKHLFILVFPNTAGSVNQAKIKVSDFNEASFSSKTLETKSSFIDADNQVISVKLFENKKAAMDYYIAFKVNKTIVQSLNTTQTYFVITEKNFATLFLEKDISKYLEFFKKNYLD